jgi:hypothetical protein
MPKKKKQKEPHTFQISPVQYDENFKEFKTVILDGKEILRLDFSTYMGHRRDQTKDLLEILTAKIGRPVSKEELNRAMMLGVINP